jgi:hypothetical protein
MDGRALEPVAPKALVHGHNKGCDQGDPQDPKPSFSADWGRVEEFIHEWRVRDGQLAGCLYQDAQDHPAVAERTDPPA